MMIASVIFAYRFIGNFPVCIDGTAIVPVKTVADFVTFNQRTFEAVPPVINPMTICSDQFFLGYKLAVGYFTKHGDGGVDILPLGNLVKEQVRELARFLDIPQPIIDKPPSAGLWPGQTDEDEMGISYEELDRYLLTGEAPDGLREKIETRMAANAHKRLPPPVAIL